MESSHRTGPLTSVMEGQPPRLLDQVRARMRRLGLAMRTEEAFVGWIRRFILAHGKRHPREMGEREVESFLSDLAVRGRVAASTQTQALSALLFLYREVLGVELPWMENICPSACRWYSLSRSFFPVAHRVSSYKKTGTLIPVAHRVGPHNSPVVRGWALQGYFKAFVGARLARKAVARWFAGRPASTTARIGSSE